MARAYIEKLLILDKNEKKIFKINKTPIEKGLVSLLTFVEDKYDISLKKLQKKIDEENIKMY